MEMIFDPRQTEMVPASRGANSPLDVERLAFQLMQELIAENRAKGKANPYLVAVKHRRSGDVRRFDFTPNPRARNGYEPLRSSAIAEAEHLLRGQWRLATDEEYAAAVEAQKAYAKAKAERRLAVRDKAVELLTQDANFANDVDIVRGKATKEATRPAPKPPAHDPKESTPTAGATAAAPAVEPPPPAPAAPADAPATESQNQEPGTPDPKPASKPKASKKAAKTIKTGE